MWYENDSRIQSVCKWSVSRLLFSTSNCRTILASFLNPMKNLIQFGVFAPADVSVVVAEYVFSKWPDSLTFAVMNDSPS